MKQEREIQMSPEGEAQIAVNGFMQVLDMLRVADPSFRESLLQRMAKRDPVLAAKLRRELAAGNN